MRYFIKNNYISDEFCEKLVDDSISAIPQKKDVSIHNSRVFFSSTDFYFNELLTKSISWKKLEDLLNSNNFLDFCLENLNIKKDEFFLVNYFKIKKPNTIQENYKKISGTINKLVPTGSLVKYAALRFFRDIYRKIKFSKIFYPKKKPIELLYDFSKAGNGYGRKIHRDSDNRTVTFLLYLNALPQKENQKGGDFDIYEIVGDNKNAIAPDEKVCKKIKSISPEAGRLVVFLNENDSYHGVEEMKNFSDYRYFIYGSFTLLSQKNPYITNDSRSKTEFHIYE